jgi:hypothetical protein
MWGSDIISSAKKFYEDANPHQRRIESERPQPKVSACFLKPIIKEASQAEKKIVELPGVEN